MDFSNLWNAINIDIAKLEWFAATQFAAILGTLLALLLIAHILRSPRMPAASIGWIITIIAMPLIGIPLYLTFGERKLRSKINRKAKINTACECECTTNDPIDTILTSLGLPASTTHNNVVFHKDGPDALADLLAMFAAAEKTIDIAMFILRKDATGLAILDALAERARAGVKVRLLLDGVGSFSLFKGWLRPAKDAGVEIAWFIPVLHHPFRGKTNLRNHRKIVIVDDRVLWTGGRNFADEYFVGESGGKPWIDLSYRLEGTAVAVFKAIFETDWEFAHGRDEILPLEPPPEIETSGSRVQVIPSGPDVEGDPVYAAFLTACFDADERITIVTPYFIPDHGVQEALKLAALRGVRVDLILPEHSNHRIADIARRRFLRELLESHVNIWMVPEQMVHAKAMVVDRHFATAGSANLDIRSLFLNCEVVNGFYSPEEVDWLSDWCEALRLTAKPYTPRKVGAVGQTLEGLVLIGGYQL